MDFRAIKPEDIAWAPAGPRGPAARSPLGGGRVAVQTPLCACKVSVQRPGMYRLDLALRPHMPAHAAFAAWLRGVESEAATALRGVPGYDRPMSACVYNDGLRLMAFSDTLTYDEDGRLSADLLSAAGCECLIELSGTWSGDSRWGLRWRVAQLRFVREVSFPPAPAIDDDDEPASEIAAAGALAFLDDD